MVKHELPQINDLLVVADGKFVYTLNGTLRAGDVIQLIQIDEREKYHLKMIKHGSMKNEDKVETGSIFRWGEKTFRHKLKTLERMREAE